MAAVATEEEEEEDGHELQRWAPVGGRLIAHVRIMKTLL